MDGEDHCHVTAFLSIVFSSSHFGLCQPVQQSFR